MWTPRERIKHPLPVVTWPTADVASRSLLFSKLSLTSGLTLEERTWVPAMVPWRATDDGFVTDDVLEWYGRFADGEPGAIVVEATGIRDVPSGPLLRAGHDRFTPGLAKIADVVRRRSGGRTKLFIQLIDFLRVRRRPEPEKFFLRHLELDDALRARAAEAGIVGQDEPALRQALLALNLEGHAVQLQMILGDRNFESLARGFRDRVTDMHEPSVAELPRVLPELFATAARRAQQAGFDGIELHYAHAYTMASFLSALNTREDGYGGDITARARLPLEVFAAVRSAVGTGFTVGCRMLCDEIIEGGNHIEDAAEIAVRFGQAGMDFISLSTGGKFDDAKQPPVGEAVYPYTGQSGYECMPTTISDARGPFGRNIQKQSTIRAALRSAGLSTPVVVAGGISTFELAESVLQQGHGDIIGAARQSLADPDWFKKVRLGHGDEIRRCIYRNYCEALDQKHKQVTCQLWDKEPASGDATTKDGRRRLVAPPWSGHG